MAESRGFLDGPKSEGLRTSTKAKTFSFQIHEKGLSRWTDYRTGAMERSALLTIDVQGDFKCHAKLSSPFRDTRRCRARHDACTGLP